MELRRVLAVALLGGFVGALILLSLGATIYYGPNQTASIKASTILLDGNVQVTGNLSAARAMTTDSLNVVAKLFSNDCILGNTFIVAKDSLRTAGLMTLGVKAFASLGAPVNGSLYYCPDCTAGSSPATGGGSGAVVIRQNGAWKAL